MPTTSTRTIYRIEHKDEGYGPYLKMVTEEFNDEDYDDLTYSDVHYEVEGLHDAHERSTAHPGPRDDGLGRCRTDDHVHGFDSRELADKWFKGFKWKLKAAGFVVNVYEAPEDSTFTSDSGKQTIFLKNRSRLVDTQSILRYRS